MKSIIAIDGGVGRCITAIPALLKYYKNNPDKEWYIMIPVWNFVTWGFPELQDRTFDPDSKGSFDLFLKVDEVISPEPYRLPAYYKHEISLREAFDVLINKSKNHDDLPQVQWRSSFTEKRTAFDLLNYVKQEQKKEKTIVIQPYGSNANFHESGIYDESFRSIPQPMLDFLIDNLSKDYNLIYMGAKEFYNNPKIYKPDPDPNLREWASVIAEADYFIGCDSCGQHMRAASGKRASVVMAGTHKNNTSYKNFHIIERDYPFYHDAIRISSFHAHMASRLNEPRVLFTEEEIKIAYEKIIKNIENTSPKYIEKSSDIFYN